MKSEITKQWEKEFKIEEDKKEDRRLRSSIEYSNWRKSVLERDRHTCQKCGNMEGILEAHHIKSWKRFKGLRFDINNGKTLCQKCHIKTYRKYLVNYQKKRKEELKIFWG